MTTIREPLKKKKSTYIQSFLYEPRCISHFKPSSMHNVHYIAHKNLLYSLYIIDIYIYIYIKNSDLDI